MMRYDVKLIEAIEILCENGISGIALVDWENKLLANFSATDLIVIFRKKLLLLNLFFFVSF